MRKLNILLWLMALTTLARAAPSPRDIQEENLYNRIVLQLKSDPQKIVQTAEESSLDKLFVDALWDVITVEASTPLMPAIDSLPQERFELADRIRLQILRHWPEKTELTFELTSQLGQLMKTGTLDRRTRSVITSYRENLILPAELNSLIRGLPTDNFRTKNKAEVQDLFFNTPDLANYENGRYRQGIRLFMFCRRDRRYPCRLLMKDKNNQPVFREDGHLWNQPSLGLSKLGNPYNQRNGNTPSGVYTMDSVMPYPDKQTTYGKFRRVILNFIPDSSGETALKKFLPESAHAAAWWRESVVARDIGRNLLRIHGTGTITTEPGDPNHPLRPTFGCVMQREGDVDDQIYIDQRHLLDQMMAALNLPVEYSNETGILGAFYIIDLDNQKHSVTYQDLVDYLDL